MTGSKVFLRAAESSCMRLEDREPSAGEGSLRIERTGQLGMYGMTSKGHPSRSSVLDTHTLSLYDLVERHLLVTLSPLSPLTPGPSSDADVDVDDGPIKERGTPEFGFFWAVNRGGDGGETVRAGGGTVGMSRCGWNGEGERSDLEWTTEV